MVEQIIPIVGILGGIATVLFMALRHPRENESKAVETAGKLMQQQQTLVDKMEEALEAARQERAAALVQLDEAKRARDEAVSRLDEATKAREGLEREVRALRAEVQQLRVQVEELNGTHDDS